MTKSVSTMASAVIGFFLVSLVVIGAGMLVAPGTAEAAVRVDSNTVVVENGDTLSEIARDFLGDASRFDDIADLNDIDNPNLIRVGQVLDLPGTVSDDDNDGNGNGLFELLILDEVLGDSRGSGSSSDLVDLFLLQKMFD